MIPAAAQTRHRFTRPACLLALASMLAGAAPAHAAKMMFGDQEHLEKIQDLTLKGRDGEALYLGYKYTHHAFVAPYHVSDDGYILGIVGQKRYYKLDAAMIEQLQARGQLPKPLPPYRLSIVDYLLGYLLWIVLGIVGIGAYFAHLKSKKQEAAIPVANEGLEHERNGDWDAAIAQYSKALEIHPKFADVLCRRANAYHNKQDYDRAIADYSAAIAAAPKDAVPLLSRGTVFEAKHMTQQAIDDYSRAIKINKDPLAYFVRALARMKTGDFAAAITDLTSAIGKQPEFIAAYQNRATAYEHTGKSDLAAADHRRAAELTAQYQAASAQAT